MAGWQFPLIAHPVTPTLLYKPQKASDLRTTPFIQRKHWQLNTALLISLAFHALLLSVAFGGQTFGLPGLNFPWQERRLGADDLQIFLAPAQPAAPASTLTPALPNISPSEIANAGLTAVEKAAVASKVSRPPALRQSEVAAESIPTPATVPAPPSTPLMTASKQLDTTLPLASDASPVKAPANAVVRDIPVQASEAPVASTRADAVQKQIEQEASRERALEQARIEQTKQDAERIRQGELAALAQREAARREQLRQDTARAEQTARSEAARIDAERQELAKQEGLRREALRQERARQEEKAQQDAARQELQRAEAAQLEAARKETARQEQARQAQLEAARQAQHQLDAARQDAARQETARQDAIKQEAARRDAARQEAARQEALKQETARQEAVKQEAGRQEANRQELARQDAVKQETARQERAKQEQAQRDRTEQEAKREERLRAIGKQLNEEAAQRDSAVNRPSRSLLPGVSGLRRGWLFGRADANNDLVRYAEAMGRKIELNQSFDTVRTAVKQPHTQPVVTVAIRADGSVEKVTFEVSSGVAAIDEAIRNVVASHAPYGAFPPALARQYDVIEIRRTWIFDTAIRLQ